MHNSNGSYWGEYTGEVQPATAGVVMPSEGEKGGEQPTDIDAHRLLLVRHSRTR